MNLAAADHRWAGLAVSEAHDVHGGLMPPVEHQHHQDVPHLVAGAQVVQLACRGGTTSECQMPNVVFKRTCSTTNVR